MICGLNQIKLKSKTRKYKLKILFLSFYFGNKMYKKIKTYDIHIIRFPCKMFVKNVPNKTT